MSLGFLRLSPRVQNTSVLDDNYNPLKAKALSDARKRLLRNAETSLQARGKVVIPADTFVTFDAGLNFFKNPQIIAGLPANAFDAMNLQMLSMDDAEDGYCDRALASISHLTGLRVLSLDKSEISDDGMKKIAPPRQSRRDKRISHPIARHIFEGYAKS